MPKVRVNNVGLYFERHGSGRSLLLIPGIPAVVSDCATLIDEFSDAFEVVALDNRGSGGSDKPDSPYTVKQLASDTAALLGKLGVERASVIGFSFGGMVAQQLALDYPGLVDRLVLACTHPGLSSGAPPDRAVAEAFRLETDSWRQRITALAPFAFAPDYRSRHPDAYDEFVAKKASDYQPSYAFDRQVQASIRHETFDALPEIACPTLVITGTDDAVVPRDNSRIIAERIPGAELVEVPHAGHLFFIEQPSLSLAAIRAFLMGGR